MTDAQMEKHGGLHFRLDDGSVYFIRSEVLEACKLSGEELEGAERDLGERGTKSRDLGKAGAKVKARTPAVTESVFIERDMPPLEFSPIGEAKLGASLKVAPTVMCCW
ncbi:hypothetical protein GCM10023168_13790 [Fodinibacter luteus]|uniref:Uncharacterized protein n=1 Tax=Fodinibacter luteus TaxID=552064 RepID=A0ABP8KAE4_9MICO